MKVTDVVQRYIITQRSFGKKFISSDRILRRFSRGLENIDISDIDPQQITIFLKGKGALTNTWKLKFSVLSGFFRFAISRGYCQTSPLPEFKPKLPPSQTPYVYSVSELNRLIDLTKTLYDYRSKQQSSMFRTLILILYGSGLRVGEALRLKISDVDFSSQILTVRDTKFYKTRLVPIGPRLSAELATHIERRSLLPLPSGNNSYLLTSLTGRGWSYSQVITLFQRLRNVAGIERPPGELHPPRLHDLRHTAAVHRVLAWYREGKNVQLLLPQLATYLGHVNISSTQRYLSMTSELLEEANRLFANYALSGDENE
ncbi:tyrosine-type recombinase/integrase [Salmonella enterica subsp. enterica]|nr:tyrosine-type recombinase/integrase [Salmonella enterica subsp. enterica serovar Brazzaville]